MAGGGIHRRQVITGDDPGITRGVAVDRSGRPVKGHKRRRRRSPGGGRWLPTDLDFDRCCV
jgi:hypothetical protein